MSDLPDLAYVRPRHLGAARAALARPGAHVYAGGTDLLVALHERRPWARFVRTLVDVKALAPARGIVARGNTVRIGALVTAAELAASPLVRRAAPVLAEAARLTSSPALRRRGTVGGNLATPHPAGDVATACSRSTPRSSSGTATAGGACRWSSSWRRRRGRAAAWCSP